MPARSALLPAFGIVAAAVALTAAAPPSAPGDAQSSPPGGNTFAFGEMTNIDVRSEAVEWRGDQLELLAFSSVKVTHDARECRLQAVVQGRALTFDEVDYTLHAAVYDRQGKLLGTASAPCHVQRLWLGYLITQFPEVELDFGASNAYAEAARVEFAITSHDVLTPEQWQNVDS